jgi:hypothetical protein
MINDNYYIFFYDLQLFHVFVQIGAVPMVNFAVHELDFSYLQSKEQET